MKVPVALTRRIQSLEGKVQILTRERNEAAKEIKRQEIVNEELKNGGQLAETSKRRAENGSA